MAHLDELIKGVMEESLAAGTPNEKEIAGLVDVIKAEEQSIDGEFYKIGKKYYELHSDKTDGAVGELVAGVNESKKKIRASKLKIGELMGFTFCETCGGQVDEDALYCNNCGAKMPVKLMPGMVLCPHCNKAVREGIRFCTNCGGSMIEEEKPMEKVCPNCGFTTTDMTMMFCDNCGRRLEGGEEEAAAEEEVKVPTHKVCPNCGFKVFDIETMFCDNCGRRLEEDKEA